MYLRRTVLNASLTILFLALVLLGSSAVRASQTFDQLSIANDFTFAAVNLTAQPGDIIATRGDLLLAVNPVTGVRTVLSDFSNPAQGPTGSSERVATGPGGAIYVIGNIGQQLGLYGVSPNGTRVIVSDPANSAQGPPFHSADTPAVDIDGSILVTDRGIGGGGNDGGVWRVNASTGFRTKLLTTIGSPQGIALDSTNQILIGDAEDGTDCNASGRCGTLSKVDRVTGARTLLSDFGNPAQGPLGEDAGFAVAKDTDGSILVTDPFAPPCPSGTSPCGVVFRWNPATNLRSSVTNFADTTQGAASFRPSGVAVAANGTIFINGCFGSNGAGAICTVNRSTGVRTIFSDAGNPLQGPLGGLTFGSLAIMQTPVEPPAIPRLKITGGDILVGSPGQGIILRSPNGATCKILSVGNSGAMVLTTIVCP